MLLEGAYRRSWLAFHEIQPHAVLEANGIASWGRTSAPEKPIVRDANWQAMQERAPKLLPDHPTNRPDRADF